MSQILTETFRHLSEATFFRVYFINPSHPVLSFDLVWRLRFKDHFGTELEKYADASYQELYINLRRLQQRSEFVFQQHLIEHDYRPLIELLVEKDQMWGIGTWNTGNFYLLSPINPGASAPDQVGTGPRYHAAASNRIELMKYFEQQGCPDHRETLSLCMKNHNLEGITYLIGRHRPNLSLFDLSMVVSRPDLFNLLYEYTSATEVATISFVLSVMNKLALETFLVLLPKLWLEEYETNIVDYDRNSSRLECPLSVFQYFTLLIAAANNMNQPIVGYLLSQYSINWWAIAEVTSVEGQALTRGDGVITAMNSMESLLLLYQELPELVDHRDEVKTK